MPGPSRSRTHPALRLAAVRQLHTYLGVLIAPSVLFFAVTGSLQLFSLHEAHGDYHPPAIVEGLASVHKDQVYRIRSPRAEIGEGGGPSAGPPHGPPDAAAGHSPPGDHGPGEHGPPKPTVFALKILFLVVAAGLVVSTSLGLWMALLHGRRKALLWALLAIGVVLPILLVVA